MDPESYGQSQYPPPPRSDRHMPLDHQHLDSKELARLRCCRDPCRTGPTDGPGTFQKMPREYLVLRPKVMITFRRDHGNTRQIPARFLIVRGIAAGPSAPVLALPRRVASRRFPNAYANASQHFPPGSVGDRERPKRTHPRTRECSEKGDAIRSAATRRPRSGSPGSPRRRSERAFLLASRLRRSRCRWWEPESLRDEA
jgi:hypothetical protein